MGKTGVGRSGLAFALGLGMAGAAFAQAAPGATGVAVADPAVPRPATRPCTVNLLSGATFDDFSPRGFSYAPPAACAGPWSKIVLEADFSVTAGRQFDRTATLWLGGVNLYFGTTQEPSAAVAPSWHVERDLTDYAPLFKRAQQGQAFIGNVVDGTYTGIIHGSAKLVFYPAGLPAPAADASDAVYPLGADPVGATVALERGGDKLARTLSLPRNVERAYLDVFTQSQAGDEFWYTCVPDAYAEQAQSCGGGSFREAEISIDGQAAGVAPVYPWIYTGGIDPYLWRPTPGVQTLNFMPYRVDLTPFAGLLSDGAPHEVAVQVAGANGHFAATAALLVYRDPHRPQVTGALVRNTLAGQPATPQVSSTLATGADGTTGGSIDTTAQRSFVIEGYALTSHGKVTTRVTQRMAFANRQDFSIDASTYRQAIAQHTDVERSSRTSIGALSSEYREELHYPLELIYDQVQAADQSSTTTTSVRQGYRRRFDQRLLGLTLYGASVDNRIDTTDALHYDAAGSLSGHQGRSAQRYAYGDTLGACYRATVTAANGGVDQADAGRGCPGGVNRVPWSAHPDGSPDGRAWQPAL